MIANCISSSCPDSVDGRARASNLFLTTMNSTFVAAETATVAIRVDRIALTYRREET